MFSGFKSGVLAAVAVVALAAPSARAQPAATVQPVVIDLATAGSGSTQTVNIANTGSAALPIEVRVEALTFEDGEPRSTGASQDLTVFPTQAIVQPGRSQSFRVQWNGDSTLASGRSYYVTLAQVPVQLAPDQSALQVLYNFQVLASVAPANARPSLQVESATIGQGADGNPAPVVVLRNDSPTQAYLSRGTLSLVQRDGQGRSVFERTLTPADIQQTIGFGLVAPGQRRSVTLPLSLPSGAGTLEARFVPAR